MADRFASLSEQKTQCLSICKKHQKAFILHPECYAISLSAVTFVLCDKHLFSQVEATRSDQSQSKEKCEDN